MKDDQGGDALARVRDIALLLPGAAEQATDGEVIFAVEDRAFAKIGTTGDRLLVRTADDERAWREIRLNAESDWTLVEDRVARSWELAAPTGLLEAGGR